MNITENQKLALAYVRVSTDQQDTERQVLDIRQYCDRNGFTIVDFFSEKVSGGKKGRSFIKDLVDYFINNQNVRYLIVQEQSRLGRTYEIPSIIEDLLTIGVCFISIWDDIRTINDDGTTNNQSIENVGYAAIRSKAELSRMKERIKSGIYRNATYGKVSTRLYGYDLIDKQLIINQNEADIIKKIYNRIADGDTIINVCKWLNMNNIQTMYNKRWHPATLIKIIKNKTYTGIHTYAGITIDIPQIIDVETFNNVQMIIKKNKGNQKTKHDYILNNKKIICGICNNYYSPIIPNYFKKQKKYKCKTKINKQFGITNNCNNVLVDVDTLERIVLFTFLKNEKAKKIIENEFNNNNFILKKINENTEKIMILENEMKKIEQKINRIVSLAIDGVITANEAKQKKIVENNKKIKIENEIKKIKNETEQLILIKNENINIIKLIENENNKEIIKEKINKIIEKIVINPTTVNSRKSVMIHLYIYGISTPIIYIYDMYLHHMVYTGIYVQLVEINQNSNIGNIHLDIIDDIKDFLIKK